MNMSQFSYAMALTRGVVWRAPMCAALTLAASALLGAEGRKAAPELPPELRGPRFMGRSLANYMKELDDLMAAYKARGGELPSLHERFLSGKGLRRPRTITISVTQGLGPDELEANREPRKGDWKIYLRTASFKTLGSALAIDDLSADVLNTVTSVPVVLSGGWVAIRKVERTTKDGKKLSGDEIARFGCGSAIDIRAAMPESVDLRLPSGLVLSSGQTRIEAEKPGHHEVTIVGRNVFEGLDGGLRDKDGQWIKLPKAKIASEKVLGKRTVVARLVSKVGLIGEDLGDPARTPMATFFERANPMNRAQAKIYRPAGIIVSDGREETVKPLPWRRNCATPKIISGSTFAIRPGMQASYVGGTGPTRFRVELGTGAHTRRATSPDYTISANDVYLKITPEPTRGYQIVAGQSYKAQIVAGGGFAWRRLKVRWHPVLYASNRGRGSRGTPRDVQAQGAWGTTTSAPTTQLAFGRDVLGTWSEADFQPGTPQRRLCPILSADLLDDDGNQILTLTSPVRLEVIRPPLKAVQLMARRPGDEWQTTPAQIDLFSSETGVNSEIEIRAALTFADGTVVQNAHPNRLRWGSLRIDGDAGLFRSNDEANLARYTAVCSSLKGGKASFRLYVHPMAVGRGPLAAFADKPPAAAPVSVTVNRLMLSEQRAADKQCQRYRLMVFGPVKMGGYKAKWAIQMTHPTSTKATLTKGFVSSGSAGSESAVDIALAGAAPSGYVAQVMLVDPRGNPVAVLHGTAGVEVRPQVRLEFPRTVTSKQQLIVKALIQGLPLDLANRSYCRWSVSPDVGRFASPKTRISSGSSGRAESTAVLVLDPRRAPPGTKPTITAELVLAD